tara:strand:+ start:2715 stop:2933 length:219 start_codon:yes stop_codon:yes gene_type:complete
MFDIIKLGLVVWGTLFLMIFFFVTFVLWGGCSLWWIVTNVMIDRTTFIVLTTSLSFGLSLLMIIGTAFSEEK